MSRKLTQPIRSPCYVAVSGGIDSMVALHFLSRAKSPVIVHCDHGTEYGAIARKFVTSFAAQRGISINVHEIDKSSKPTNGLENHWRKFRMGVFNSYDAPVITAHHLNDVMESYLMGVINGHPRMIAPYSDEGNMSRPFLLWTREDIEAYARKHKVPYLEDPSNADTRFTRNYVRHVMMENVLRINPGFTKVIRKKVLAMI